MGFYLFIDEVISRYDLNLVVFSCKETNVSIESH